MPGVNILHSEAVKEWGFHPTVLVVGIVIAAVILGRYFFSNYRWLTIEDVLLAIAEALIIVSVITIYSGAIVPEDGDTIRYKVTIDADVSMTEFYEKYEIISQDGKIFTVEEK